MRVYVEQFWIGIYILQREGGPGRILGGSGKQCVVKEKNLPLTILKGVDPSEAGGGHGLAGANGAGVDDAGCHGGLLRDEPLDLGRLIGFKYERTRFDIGEEPLLCHAVTKDVIMNVAFGEELAQERNVFALVGIGETFIEFVEGLLVIVGSVAGSSAELTGRRPRVRRSGIGFICRLGVRIRKRGRRIRIGVSSGRTLLPFCRRDVR